MATKKPSWPVGSRLDPVSQPGKSGQMDKWAKERVTVKSFEQIRAEQKAQQYAKSLVNYAKYGTKSTKKK
jgi:hypothetical protein